MFTEKKRFRKAKDYCKRKKKMALINQKQIGRDGKINRRIQENISCP